MKELICIVCPKGCHLKVDESTLNVTGNGCPRGAEYGKNELSHPMRMVTSTVRIEGALHRRCPVKTSQSIPKDKMFDVVKALNGVVLQAPVKVGQVIVKNVAGTDADIVAAKNM